MINDKYFECSKHYYFSIQKESMIFLNHQASSYSLEVVTLQILYYLAVIIFVHSDSCTSFVVVVDEIDDHHHDDLVDSVIDESLDLQKDTDDCDVQNT